MKALAVTPGRPGSGVLLERPEPSPEEGALLCATAAVGLCGTDRDIFGGRYGSAPIGRERLVLGHECAGRVLEAPPGSGFEAGDWIVPIVRRPDPDPCACCAAGEWDMCVDGRFTECGISGRDGFMAERFRTDPAFAVRGDPALGEANVLLETCSVVAKAWEQIERISARACSARRRVLVTGAGPVGLLAALLGRQRGLEVHVVDRATAGPKPGLVEALGARYHASMEQLRQACGSFDAALECTGAPQLVMDLLCATGPGSVTCLTGISSGRRMISIDMAWLNRSMVLENSAVFGTVNSNRRHYEAARSALAAADRAWVERLLTRRVPLARWREALEKRPDDVKVALLP